MLRIREIRKARSDGMTMKQLGEIVGVTESAIGYYETGKREPDYEMLLRISEALDCSVGDLLGVEGGRIGQENEKNPAVVDDEMTDLLQVMRDREDLRALLHVGRNNTPEQVQKIIELMETMNR